MPTLIVRIQKNSKEKIISYIDCQNSKQKQSHTLVVKIQKKNSFIHWLPKFKGKTISQTLICKGKQFPTVICWTCALYNATPQIKRHIWWNTV